ncbi:glycosyltransferase family 2 protein [Acidocella sp. MX-AZ03]|uniref:glycosyltransferase family 2 protein n=1 Tax=Acidocella sp. MX-AZ03 TaxID=2697363 RepID=UPI0022DD37D2|nr:glycosyltransferase family 2 protein [Acidocella sp. MX-AZ03]WBO60371.1 glycosyltransferase family 2 protein [Acidocella sp. MX-AZ03]
MTKIVSFTRILNEDDIVEAFVRHHAAHVDEMLFLDNGSTDRTLEILQELLKEGFPLRVFRSHAVSFDEIAVNSWGYQAASQVLGADWVLFLDADEFVATPASAPLVTLLPADAPVLSLELANYGQVGGEDAAELVVPWRLRWRMAAPSHVIKVIARAKIPGLVAGAGNHGVFLQGQEVAPVPLPETWLAHYPRRSAWQAMQKWAAGRMKALAAGGQDDYFSQHYISPMRRCATSRVSCCIIPAFSRRNSTNPGRSRRPWPISAARSLTRPERSWPEGALRLSAHDRAAGPPAWKIAG